MARSASVEQLVVEESPAARKSQQPARQLRAKKRRSSGGEHRGEDAERDCSPARRASRAEGRGDDRDGARGCVAQVVEPDGVHAQAPKIRATCGQFPRSAHADRAVSLGGDPVDVAQAFAPHASRARTRSFTSWDTSTAWGRQAPPGRTRTDRAAANAARSCGAGHVLLLAPIGLLPPRDLTSRYHRGTTRSWARSTSGMRAGAAARLASSRTEIVFARILAETIANTPVGFDRERGERASMACAGRDHSSGVGDEVRHDGDAACVQASRSAAGRGGQVGAFDDQRGLVTSRVVARR